MTNHQARLNGLYVDNQRFHSIMNHYMNSVINTPYMEEYDSKIGYVLDCKRCDTRFISDVCVEYCPECVNKFDIKRVI